MLMLRTVTTLGLLAAGVIADLASIKGALNQVDQDTAQLNNTILEWSGDLLGALPIVVASTTLENDIKSGTKTAKKSANLTDSDAINLVGTVTTLSADVNTTLDSLIAAKPKFEALLLTGIIEVVLKSENDATNKLISAIIAKVPADLQAIATSLTAGITAKFSEALAAYNS